MYTFRMFFLQCSTGEYFSFSLYSKLGYTTRRHLARDLLSMLAVFSVVISTSGSVKYSDATQRPFSGPERERERQSSVWLICNNRGIIS